MVIFIRVNEVKLECWYFDGLTIKVVMSLLLSRVWVDWSLLWRIVDLSESREVRCVSEVASTPLRCEISVLLSDFA